MRILYTLVAAGIGGFVGLKLKLPAGAFIGAYIGLSFSKDSIGQIKELIGPIIVMVIGLFAASILLGLFILDSRCYCNDGGNGISITSNS